MAGRKTKQSSRKPRKPLPNKTGSKPAIVSEELSTNLQLTSKTREANPVWKAKTKINKCILAIKSLVENSEGLEFNNTLKTLELTLTKKSNIPYDNNKRVKLAELNNLTKPKLIPDQHFDQLITNLVNKLAQHATKTTEPNTTEPNTTEPNTTEPNTTEPNTTVLNNLLIIATTQADLSATESLLMNNLVDKNFVDAKGYSALHYAVIHGDVKKIEALIANGADINIQNKDGNTPLHAAVILKRTEAIKLLLDYGADVNEKDINKNTALHFAAEAGYQEAIGLLQAKNADFTIQDEEGLTSLDRAIKHTKETIDNIDFPAQEQETVWTQDGGYNLTPEITEQKKNWQQKIPSLLGIIQQLDSQKETEAKFDVGQINKVSEAINQWNCGKPNSIEGSKILGLWNNLIEERAQGEDSNNLETPLTQLVGDTTQVEVYSEFD